MPEMRGPRDISKRLSCLYSRLLDEPPFVLITGCPSLGIPVVNIAKITRPVFPRTLMVQVERYPGSDMLIKQEMNQRTCARSRSWIGRDPGIAQRDNRFAFFRDIQLINIESSWVCISANFERSFENKFAING